MVSTVESTQCFHSPAVYSHAEMCSSTTTQKGQYYILNSNLSYMMKYIIYVKISVRDLYVCNSCT